MFNLLLKYSPLISASIAAALIVGAANQVGARASDAINASVARVIVASLSGP